MPGRPLLLFPKAVLLPLPFILSVLCILSRSIVVLWLR